MWSHFRRHHLATSPTAIIANNARLPQNPAHSWAALGASSPVNAAVNFRVNARREKSSGPIDKREKGGKMAIKLIFAILLSLSAAGCGTFDPKNIVPLNPELRPALSEDLQNAQAMSKVCARPFRASNPGPNFRYGCFCGKGYPALVANSAASSPKQDLIRQYYEIKPIDSIDAACRDHDVCWVMHGDGDGRCNEEFNATLEYIGDYLNSQYKRGNAANLRCQILAGDVRGPFLTLLVSSRYDDSAQQVGASLGRAFAFPIYAFVAGLFSPMMLFENWPSAEERCNAPPQPVGDDSASPK